MPRRSRNATRDEERRLAYVAFTRARTVLLASGYAWDTTKTAARRLALPGRAERVRRRRRVVRSRTPTPRTRDVGVAETAGWPRDPLGVGARTSRPARHWCAPRRTARSNRLRANAQARAARCRCPGSSMTPDRGIAAWRARRRSAARRACPPGWRRHDRRRAAAPALGVATRRARTRSRRPRPPPAPTPAGRPAPLARRGTAFHAWLEQRWSAQTLLDVDDLPGAADEDADDSRCRRAAGRLREQRLGRPHTCRGRGAVRDGRTTQPSSAAGWTPCSASPSRGFTVVDWKTGARPTGPTRARGRGAVGRVPAGLGGLSGSPRLAAPCGAAFHYVRSDETVATGGPARRRRPARADRRHPVSAAS